MTGNKPVSGGVFAFSLVFNLLNDDLTGPFLSYNTIVFAYV